MYSNNLELSRINYVEEHNIFKSIFVSIAFLRESEILKGSISVLFFKEIIESFYPKKSSYKTSRS